MDEHQRRIEYLEKHIAISRKILALQEVLMWIYAIGGTIGIGMLMHFAWLYFLIGELNGK